ncbi:phosphate regulon sensor histidine kinase PhoR [Novilysobacter antarcticus]|uniref:phosphate regulon sensor histidine kinase PhoR n=1 Tax=Novilysobacter antarcticus TaxID=2862543 RepID=UPI001C998FEB|nr:phosphate regulon sensor histidine kinase PhoR [Lysobacter antarcticus]
MTPAARSAWLRTLGLTVVGLAITGVLGVAVGQFWPVLALGAVAMLGWQHWRLGRVLHRLGGRRWPTLTAKPGAWSELDRLHDRDQRERRVRKRRLLEMLRAYRAAAAALPDAVVVVERNSQRIRWFNQAAATLLGLRYPADVGAPLVPRLRPLPLAQWLASGRHADTLEVASPVNPATRLSLRLIPYSENLWLLVARDVTRLLQLEQMRRDFVANVSHELRTPLTVIHGYLDMIDPDEHSGLAPVLGEMQRQSQRMARLVEDLLALSRLEAADGAPLEERVAMDAMLDTLRREGLALGQGRHRIRVENTADVDLWGSGTELHSAFSNLVGNAVRHTPEGGEVLIRFRREDPRGDGQAGEPGGVVLEVIDSGIGIAAEHLPRITERFYRVSNSRSRTSGGTGLGLAIVKHVLQRHHARLEVRSRIGDGSMFSCHFTAARVRPRERGASHTAPSEAMP